MANRFVLEVRQAGAWVNKGGYSSLRTALQSRSRRFPAWDSRVVNLDNGNIERLHINGHFIEEDLEQEDFGFEVFANIIGVMEQEERRFAHAEIWHRRFTEQRDTRQQLLEVQRILVQQRRSFHLVENLKKTRKAHINWTKEGF
jgi:hypothetical protein